MGWLRGDDWIGLDGVGLGWEAMKEGGVYYRLERENCILLTTNDNSLSPLRPPLSLKPIIIKAVSTMSGSAHFNTTPRFDIIKHGSMSSM